MRNPLDRLRQWQVRRRVTRHRISNRPALTPRLAVVALILIVTAALVLEWREGGRGAEAQTVEALRERAAEPLPMITGAARAHRLVFVADVSGAAAPKRFFADVLEAIARGPGIDAVALPVDADLQEHIDRYLESMPEDPAILLARPRALREWEGTGREFLEIYRRVHQLNQELGADRRIQVLAIDPEGWPPERALSPSQLARVFTEREARTRAILGERLLERNPRARILFFTDGLQALKQGGARIQTGGARHLETQWLAAALAAEHPGNVYSVLLDAPSPRAAPIHVAAYRGTTLQEAVRRARDVQGGFGVRLRDDVPTPTNAIRFTDSPGISVDLFPPNARLSDLADAYVYLGG
jgi:hypothetical protein